MLNLHLPPLSPGPAPCWIDSAVPCGRSGTDYRGENPPPARSQITDTARHDDSPSLNEPKLFLNEQGQKTAVFLPKTEFLRGKKGHNCTCTVMTGNVNYISLDLLFIFVYF